MSAADAAAHKAERVAAAATEAARSEAQRLGGGQEGGGQEGGGESRAVREPHGRTDDRRPRARRRSGTGWGKTSSRIPVGHLRSPRKRGRTTPARASGRGRHFDSSGNAHGRGGGAGSAGGASVRDPQGGLAGHPRSHLAPDRRRPPLADRRGHQFYALWPCSPAWRRWSRSGASRSTATDRAADRDDQPVSAEGRPPRSWRPGPQGRGRRRWSWLAPRRHPARAVRRVQGHEGADEGLNIIYDEEEKRGFIKLNFMALALTLGVIVAMIVALGLIVVVPIVLEFVGLGPSSTRWSASCAGRSCSPARWWCPPRFTGSRRAARRRAGAGSPGAPQSRP